MMTYLVYAALAFITLAATVCFIRSYRPIRDGKVGRRLVDLGLMFSLIFVGLIVASNASVTMRALVTGSTAAVMFIAAVGLIGLALFVAASFYESWGRSLQAWRFRRSARKMAEMAEDGEELSSETTGVHDPRVMRP